MPDSPFAIIDIGSNSARLVVFRLKTGGVLDVVVDEHISLKLIRAIAKDGSLREEAVERTLVTLADFRQLAVSSGATSIRAYGTSALREAKNGKALLARAAKETGIRVEILGGADEGRAGYVGAVYGLPVTSGLVFDIGGGSVQLTQFRNRRLQRTVSLPLGALRVSDEFLRSDPPTTAQVRKLRAHLHRVLRTAKIGSLGEGQVLVATGGTARNLAKVDARRRSYPISRLHGYDLTFARLRELTSLFLSRDGDARVKLPGLNRSRADSIVGGSIVASSILEVCGASQVLVAGQGLREGLALARIGSPLPEPAKVRSAAVATFAAGFASCDPLRARRRLRIALSLYDALEPYADDSWREMLGHAAQLFDAGRSVDYYKLQTHTAEMIRSSGLLGFSHRGIAIVSSIVELSDAEGWNPKDCAPPLLEDDFDALERAGIFLCLADAIERRREPGPPEPIHSRTSGREFVLREPALRSWRNADVSRRFREAFGKDLTIGS